MSFTVIDRIRALKIEPGNTFDWTVGAMVRDEYVRVYGALPPKALRVKTCGIGVHCFAIYPAEFRPRADEIIKKMSAVMEAEAQRQGDFFDAP